MSDFIRQWKFLLSTRGKLQACRLHLRLKSKNLGVWRESDPEHWDALGAKSG